MRAHCSHTHVVHTQWVGMHCAHTVYKLVFTCACGGGRGGIIVIADCLHLYNANCCDIFNNVFAYTYVRMFILTLDIVCGGGWGWADWKHAVSSDLP